MTIENASKYVSQWCSDNFLDMNVSKTKRIVFDFRRNHNSQLPVRIDDKNVELVESYK